ncbi:MAG: hypothetical protein H6588_10030 [Flavobacteriales bacterium]|nr:hypothetical protein [Flavobacteriales bacterium]
MAQNTDTTPQLNFELNAEQEQLLNSFKNKFANNYISEQDFINHTASAHYIYIDKGKIKTAIKDLKNNISFDEFILKHPETIVDSNLLVVRQQQLNFKNENVTNYTNLPATKKYLHSITTTRKTVEVGVKFKGKWVYNYVPKSKYADEFLMAFYFTSDFGFEPLINEFTNVIAYSNHIQKESDKLIQHYNQEPAINKILSFLEKLVDVCATLFISYNNPDMLKVALTNIIVPKMTRHSENIR